MLPPQQRFGHHLISQSASGGPVELRRAPHEVTFLAFDTVTKRLVELHVLKGGAAMDASERRSALDRAELATEVRGASFMRVLSAGEEGGVAYFASNLSDGEFAEDYVSRRGPLPAVTAFCLLQQFLDDLVAAQGASRLVCRMQVANPMVTSLEDAFLQLRVVDYGFSERESLSDETGMRRVFGECCRLLFLLLTGQRYEGQSVDKFPVLTSLPTNLRAHLRTALADPREASPNIERLRDDVKEAYSALVSSLQARNSRKHIAMTEALQPLSELQQVLLEQMSVEDLLRGRFELAAGEESRHHAFTIAATSVKNNQPVTVHLLPPTRVVDRSQMEAVPLQMWRFSPERHPNIVRSLSLWENPEWTFLTEEREPGFTLSRLMAERGSFNPPEVLAILKQVRAGIEQALECGVQCVDLHPSNLIFRVGKGGALQGREFEKLITKRIDAWPPFLLKLRTHMTMRSLYEPLLVEPHPDSASRDLRLATNDLRSRSFVGLAIYLLTGERQMGSSPTFGETVPPALSAYLREALETQKQFGRAPHPSDFIDAFEKHMPHEDAEGRGIAAVLGAKKVPMDEMESAGAVSDFDGEWSDSDGPGYLVNPITQKLGVKVLPQHHVSASSGSAGMVMWAIVASALLFLGWFLFRGSSDSADKKSDVAGQALNSSEPASDASINERAQATTPVAPAGRPTPVMAPNRGRTPEEIRRAIRLSAEELQKALKSPSGSAPQSETNSGLVNGTREQESVR
jgi:hypothetical protein